MISSEQFDTIRVEVLYEKKNNSMEIQFGLKEYLEKEFKNINNEIQEIKTELKEHRKIEAEIKNDVNVLKSKVNWLLCILSPIGTTLLVGIVKIVFFT